MTGETNLFATLPSGATTPAGLDPVMTFREREGVTLIVTPASPASPAFAGKTRVGRLASMRSSSA